MLSDFDTDGDSILNMWELTAMFEGMRDRLHRAKNERGRAGQGRMAQSRTVADRRGKRRDLGGATRGPLAEGFRIWLSGGGFLYRTVAATVAIN